MSDKRTKAWKIAKEIYDDSAQPADIEQALLVFAAEVSAEMDTEIARLKNVFSLTRSDVQLMAGELSANEWRTVSAVLKGLERKLKKDTK